MRASLKNAMHDLDACWQTPLMLAVRSGRYADVEAMLPLCDIDFRQDAMMSAWDQCLQIGDPEMLAVMQEGRGKQAKREWRKMQHKLGEALDALPDF